MIPIRFYARYDENGNLICFGTGYGGVEITEIEYYALKDITSRTWAATAAVVAGEITIESIEEDIREDVRRDSVAQFAEMVYSDAPIDTVPESMQQDVQAVVDTLIAERGEPDEQEISDSEALNIILGVSE